MSTFFLLLNSNITRPRRSCRQKFIIILSVLFHTFMKKSQKIKIRLDILLLFIFIVVIIIFVIILPVMFIKLNVISLDDAVDEEEHYGRHHHDEGVEEAE